MKFAIIVFAVVSAASSSLHAASPKQSGDYVEKVVNSVRAVTLKKLANPKTFEEAQADTNRDFNDNFLNKPAKFQVKVESAHPYSQGEHKFCIRAVSSPLKYPGGEMGRLVNFYFDAAKAADASKVTNGSEVVISEIIRRCEVVAPGGVVKFNFDMANCSIGR